MADELLKQKQLQEQQFVQQEEQLQQDNAFAEPQFAQEEVQEQKQETVLQKRFAEAEKRKISIDRIEETEKAESYTVTKKKGFFSKPATETKTRYKTKELSLAKRKTYSDSLKLAEENMRNNMADFRMNCSLETKKEVGFEGLKLLGSFQTVLKEEDVKKYGKNKPILNKEGVKIGESVPEGRDAVMDKLTEHILSLKAEDYKDLSDQSLSRFASRFEPMTKQLDSFKTLLDQNPEYVNKLKNAKTKSGASQYDVLKEHMDTLTVISDYYRIRKLIMTDSEYIHNTGNLDLDMVEGETATSTRLKLMIRMSQQLKNRLNRMGGGDADDSGFPAASEYAKRKYKEVDDLFAENRTVTEEGKVREMTQEEKDRAITYKIKEMELQSFSSVRYDQKKTFSLDNPPNQSISKYVAAYCFGTNFLLDMIVDDYSIQAPERHERFGELRKEHFKEDTPSVTWNLDYEINYKGVSKIGGDNIARMTKKLIYMADMMGMTQKELDEWYLNQTIAHTKEFKENSNNPAYKEYAEEANADAIMQQLIVYNALFEKLADKLGNDVFIAHPADLAARLTDEDMLMLSVVSTVTNTIKSKDLGAESNQAILDFFHSYKERHPDAPTIDPEKFILAADVHATLQFNAGFAIDTDIYLTLQNGEEVDDYDFDLKRYQKYLGDAFTKNEVEQWYEANKESPEVQRFIKVMNIPKTETFSPKILSAFLYHHPEKINADSFKLTNLSKNAISMNTYGREAGQDMKNLAKLGYIKPRSLKEIKAYEASLKKRDIVGKGALKSKGEQYLAESDPYDMLNAIQQIVLYHEGKQERGEELTPDEVKEMTEAKAELKRRVDGLKKQMSKLSDTPVDEVKIKGLPEVS